jgi:hypothetical protein
MAYTKKTYVNGTTPAINAANLNSSEQGIYDAQLYGADAGGDDTYVLNLSTTLVEGMTLRMKVTTGNTGAATLSIDNGSTTKSIKVPFNSGLADPRTGDIPSGAIITLIYDGTYWQLQGNFTPSGIINMWSGTLANIPTGWVLCDGSNSTPDLRDKFVRGAANGANPGSTGGSDSITLSIDNLPSHSHHYNTFTSGGSLAFNNASSNWQYVTNVDSEAVGGGVAFDNKPAYYAIAFIMKI